MSTAVKPPTTEVGSVAWPTLPGWSSFIEQPEHVAELRWPKSVTTYDQVRRDAQVAGLMRGITLPIRRLRWSIEPNGADPALVRDLAADLGLPVAGAEASPAPRRSRRFSHDAHLTEALRALIYGHAFMEQVGEIAGERWRLRKLAPRPQRTISRIEIARDGGLVSITQAFGLDNPAIPVSRLVAYVWDQEPGSWIGNSMLRELHRPWVLKDRILRVGALNIEKGGGVVYGVGAPGMNEGELAALAQTARDFRAGGLDSGGAVPYGAELKFAAASGQDGAVPYVHLQNEEMARALLMMFMQLGQTQTGSRALGGDFIEFFSQAQDALADWYAGVTNEHVIEDWVDWNVGPDAQAPLLVWDRAEDPALSIEELVSLLEAGAITLDDELEDWLRASRHLPARGTTPRRAPSAPAVAARGRSHPGAAREARAAAEPFRREPTDTEVRAAVDFAAIEARYSDGKVSLVEDWQAVRAEQIDQLVDQIEALDPDNLAALARIAATPAGADLLTDAQVRVIEDAARAAVAEAAAQGRALDAPDLEDSRDAAARRADATAELLARSLSEAAARDAVRRAGQGSSADLAAAVRAHLEGLSDVYLAEQFGGLLARAEGEGRAAVYREGEDLYTSWVVSALLDRNVCQPCAANDGTIYTSIEDVEAQYPGAAQNVDCLGGARCRCVVVGLFEGESAS